jgi:hypothetical protein
VTRDSRDESRNAGVTDAGVPKSSTTFGALDSDGRYASQRDENDS